MKNYQTILLAFLALIALTTASHTCELSMLRSETGVKLQCACPGRFTAIIPVEASVNVEIDCLKDCYTSVEDACKSANISKFHKVARNARASCCSKCGGTFKDFKCQRIILEGRPLVFPVNKGCVHKVRGTSMGHAYACKCADGKNFEVPFFIASGVEEDCLDRCGERKLVKRCVMAGNEGMIRFKFVQAFGKCCESCGGVKINGGYACGYDLA